MDCQTSIIEGLAGCGGIPEIQPDMYAEVDSLHLCIDYLLGGYQFDLFGEADMMVSKSIGRAAGRERG